MKKSLFVLFTLLLAACGHEESGRVRTGFKPFMNQPNKNLQKSPATGDHKVVRGHL